jgi:hypothetical protein
MGIGFGEVKKLGKGESKQTIILTSSNQSLRQNSGALPSIRAWKRTPDCPGYSPKN